MIRKIGAAAGVWLLFTFPATGHCVDGVSLEVGRGDDRTSVLRIATQWQWRKERPAGHNWHLAGYWDLSAAVWDNHDESTADVGLTPVFRIERESLYVEAAIGLHLVQTRISAARVFSTSFQFGDHLGAGMRFDKYDFGIRLQHISNGGIRRPNPGINFLLVRFQYNLD